MDVAFLFCVRGQLFVYKLSRFQYVASPYV